MRTPHNARQRISDILLQHYGQRKARGNDPSCADFSDFSDDAELEEWFNDIAKREKRRFPTRSSIQVTMNLDHIKALLKSHYKYRFEQFRKIYNTIKK